MTGRGAVLLRAGLVALCASLGSPPVAQAAVPWIAIGPLAGDAPVQVARFKVVRDFALHFDHRLGAVEAKRRVIARLEDLRRRFANVASSTETWSGDMATMRVAAFGQTADGRIDVGERSVDVHVHLPLLLAPLGGNIEAFLQKTGVETLRN